jgi:hypothetical protein
LTFILDFKFVFCRELGENLELTETQDLRDFLDDKEAKDNGE